MAVILAIDAAWTMSQPSGVALVVTTGERPRCLAVAPSYEMFFALTERDPVDWCHGPIRGSQPDVPRLLEAATTLAGAPVDIVAVDMPVATHPFSSRRAADDAISREFGSRWCAAHSPSAQRPGSLGHDFTSALLAAGYPLRTTTSAGLRGRALIEVYPHPALLSLLGRPRRVPYKISKTRRYWPKVDAPGRVEAVLREFEGIRAALASVIENLGLELPSQHEVRSLNELKRWEDVLDAVVCAWVGVEHLAGRTVALGDETAAVWCPRDVVTQPGPGLLPRTR